MIYTITNAHAPIEDKTEDKNGEFCELLVHTYHESPINDIKIVIGDLNAKVGKGKRPYTTVGMYGTQHQQ